MALCALFLSFFPRATSFLQLPSSPPPLSLCTFTSFLSARREIYVHTTGPITDPCAIESTFFSNRITSIRGTNLPSWLRRDNCMENSINRDSVKKRKRLSSDYYQGSKSERYFYKLAPFVRFLHFTWKRVDWLHLRNKKKKTRFRREARTISPTKRIRFNRS